ncbi:hypothetical protein ACRALDRAFT_1078145 [Sodiomyces alcalophilus JCM 7366]|uniref:uncharacterized protein n=1 Tax=Sodiomyces alcalophilus JCM 7366 TaxID=591952 RepID=UPI0039B60ACE
MAFTNQAGDYLGPLTTSWSMPAACSYIIPLCSTCQVGFRGQGCSAGSPEDNTACWPPAQDVATPDPPFLGWGFYSPGIACPTGYTSACTAVHGQPPEWDIQFQLRPGETAVGCCPTGYQCTNQNGNTCIAIASTSTNVPYATCDGADVVEPTLKPFPDVVTVSRTTMDSDASTSYTITGTFTRTMTLLAPMFQLNYQATDMTSKKSSAGPRESETLSDVPADATQDAGNVGNEREPAEAGGPSLSGGAWAGVAVGAVAGLFLLGAVVWFVVKRRRAQREWKPEDKGAPGVAAQPGGPAMYTVYEVEGAGVHTGVHAGVPGHPGDGHSVRKEPTELPIQLSAELPGDSRG